MMISIFHISTVIYTILPYRDKWINALTKKEVRPKQYVSVNPMYAQSSGNNSVSSPILS